MKTIQIILLSIFIMASCKLANAQLSFGLKAGMNVATVSNYDNIDIPSAVQASFSASGSSSYRIGYNAGLFINYTAFEDRFAFQPEVLFSNQGMKYSGDIFGIPNSSFEATAKIDYVNIPLMVQFYFIKKILYIELGPQVGFIANASGDYNAILGSLSYDDNWDIRDDLNTVDFSIAAGLGFKIPKLPLGVNARYTVGLTNVSKNPGNDGSYNSVFQFGIFAKFGNND